MRASGLSVRPLTLFSMKRYVFGLLLAVCAAFTFTACDEEGDEASFSASLTSLPNTEGTVSITVIANGTWVISSSDYWLKLTESYGDGDKVVTATFSENKVTSERSATLTLRSGTVTETMTFVQAAGVEDSSTDPGEDTGGDSGEDPGENPGGEDTGGEDTGGDSGEDPGEEEKNLNANDATTHPEAARLEMPALNADNNFVSHYVTYNSEKMVNYTIEWNSAMKHAQWAAFEFNSVNCSKNVTRTNNWSVDTDLPSSMQLDNSYFTNDGFDRGHICASDDRIYSTAANDQTFFYSNMSPQLNEFNTGIWQALEARVQTWGRSTSGGTFDKVYVAKGGTLTDLLVNFTGTGNGQDGVLPTTDANGYTKKGLPCPAYYFMAILAEKDGAYSAIGFIMPHSMTLSPISGSSYTSADLKKYVVSIDELESQTGLDFFCNLVDSVEDKVEASYDLDAWKW